VRLAVADQLQSHNYAAEPVVGAVVAIALLGLGGTIALIDRQRVRQDCAVKLSSRSRTSLPSRSAFARFRFPAGVIVLAVRWYLRFGLS
jgi:hypothetical protein